ncbi:MAG: 3-dehydroquinate synthase [Azospirillaceae bacterium]
MTETVPVELGARRYEIRIGPGLIDRAGALMRPVLPRPRVIVIADERVRALHGDRLARALAEADIRADVLPVPPGEASKSFDRLGALLDALLGLGIERGDTVVAFGGGVIGDLAGVTAALALRGLPFVQIPTSLLAQVDSAVGGKTGVNSRHGKNLIGAFHQPRLVLSDTAVLDSLSARELRAGYAEIVKYGAIDRPAFFDWLESEGRAVIDGDTAARIHAIAESCRAKAEVVAADERESGRRALLNLGHTFGHALEAETGYSDRLLHGEGVALGMVLAFTLSARLGLCPPADAERVAAHLAAVGLPTGLDAIGLGPDDAEALIAHMTRDKKVADGRTTFVLARGIGRAFTSRDVDPADVAAVLRAPSGPGAHRRTGS